jgi:small subunit ribosomal protein S20
MANTPQAKKRIRRNAARAEINGARISRIRSFIKKVETARGVARGVLHKNTVARKLSRLTRRVATL